MTAGAAEVVEAGDLRRGLSFASRAISKACLVEPLGQGVVAHGPLGIAQQRQNTGFYCGIGHLPAGVDPGSPKASLTPPRGFAGIGQ